MTNVNDLKDKLAKKPEDLNVLLKAAAKDIAGSLPKHMRSEKLFAILNSLMSRNPKLSQCTPRSIVGALLTCAQLGLEPLNGRAFLIPYNNKNTGNLEAQFQTGYKGLVDLFYRHESSKNIDAHEVRENDMFDYQFGSEAKLTHIPLKTGDRGAVTHYYAIANVNGTHLFAVMTKDEVMAHGLRYSKQVKVIDGKRVFSDDSMWLKDFDSMAKKTLIIQLSKVLPISSEIQNAISADQTTRDYREGFKSALDIPVTSSVVETEGKIIEGEPEAPAAGQPAEEKPAEQPTAAEPEVMSVTPLFGTATHIDSLVAEIKTITPGRVSAKTGKAGPVTFDVTDGVNEAIIQSWDKNPDVAVLSWVKFTDITASEYNGKKQWTAKKLEIVEK